MVDQFGSMELDFRFTRCLIITEIEKKPNHAFKEYRIYRSTQRNPFC